MGQTLWFLQGFRGLCNYLWQFQSIENAGCHDKEKLLKCCKKCSRSILILYISFDLICCFFVRFYYDVVVKDMFTLLHVCVSEASANEFSAILCLLLVQSNSNSPRSFAGFRQTLVRNFIQIQQRVKKIPIDPHCKSCPLSATL